MGATTPRAEIIANSQFGSGATTYSPATWYCALSTTTPAEDGTGFTEPVGGSYARVAVTNNATNFPPASINGNLAQKSNGAKITFTNPTGNWGIVSHVGFFTASSGGTVQYWQALDSTIAPRNGNTPVEFDIGQLLMTFD